MLETLLQPNDVDERCGLILKDGTIVEIGNIAEEKSDGYEMDPVAVLPFIKDGSIEATWHTHPDSSSNLSGEDYAGFLAWPMFEHVIVGTTNGVVEVSRYRVTDGLVIACD